MSESIDTPESRGGTSTAPEPRSADIRTIRVLVVDDQPGLPETIAAYIERETSDMSVTTAKSALEAVTTLGEDTFDCIVSDYKMPAISGLEFLEVVREEDPDIPFIVFTAKGSPESASRAFETNVTDFVQKRTDTGQYDDLVQAIRQAIDHTRAETDHRETASEHSGTVTGSEVESNDPNTGPDPSQPE